MENITDSMKTFFERIRDERSMHANTANRIGNAFLMILNYLLGSDTPFLRKDREDATRYLLTLLAGAVIGESGRIRLNPDGSIICDSIKVEGSAVFNELVFNHQNVIEGDTFFTNRGVIERVEPLNEGRYRVFLRKEYQDEIITFQQNDILKCSMNNLDAGHTFKNSWMRVNTVDTETNSMDVVLYANNEVPGGANYAPVPGSVIIRWGNQANKERQSCWYISSTEKRIVMLDGVTQPKLEESNYASFYGLPFDMNNFKGYDLNPNQPYLYVRGAFLQDVCFIDYLGKVVKQERYRGVWSQEVANSDDPYVVTQTTFDTVYHKNAKWQCNSTTGSKVEPSESTTDWTKLSEGGKGSDGKSAAKAYVTSNDIAIPTDANGIVTEDFQIGNTFSLMVDGKNCTDLQVTMDGTPATDAFKAQLNQLWLTITSSKGAEFGSRAYTLHFTVKGVLDNITYSDVVTILVRPNRAGADGKNLTRVSNYYKWGVNGTEAPSGDYTENNIPEHVEGLDYLWNYEVCYNDTGEAISISEKTCIGNFARGIESITEYYRIGTAEKPDKPISVDTIDASEWQTTMPSLTAEKRYLWNLEVVRFTDGTYSISEVHLAGAQGESITIEQKLVYYAISASGTSTPPDAWFSDTIKEPTEEKPYLWTCVSIRYSDTTVVKYYTVARRGENGAPGRNLTRVVNYYKWGANGTEAPSDGYTKDNIPTHTDGLNYLWNYEECRDEHEGLISQSGKTCIGYFPKDGDPGKGIKSITEYYQIGTAIKPTNSITASDKTLTVPSEWKTTMDATTSENRFVWNQEVIQFTDGTYSISVIHLAGAQGDKGDPGEDGVDGNGMEYIYMRTEGCKAPNTPSTNGSTPTGWTKEPSGVNAEYPYEWVSMRIQDKGAWGSYSKPILWKEYYAINANLLEQTDFDGLLTKWENRSVYEGTSYEDDSINHISNDGKDGVNCYYDISSRMKYESLYKDVLIQRLVNGSVTRLKPSTWYTLSFYAKCGVNVKPVNLTSNEYGFGLRILYLEKGKRYKFSISGRIDSQAQKDGKTLWCYVYNRDWNWSKSLIIDTTSDAVKSIEFSDVPSSGTYEFRAYMYDNGGSRAGKVTLNWANVEEVDGELFSSYIYPSLIDNTKVFVDGEQKAVSSDCEVKYKASSSDWVRHTVTFKTRSTLGSKQNLLFRMLPIVMSYNTHYLKICMPKLEVGKVASAWQLNEADRMGKNGKPLVGPTEWNASAWYMSGKGDDEAYQSIVINPKYPKQMYLCGYSHSGKEPSAETSTSSVDTCTEEKPWVSVAYQDFVATKVLFAERGKIENLDITNATIQGTITDMAVKTKAEWDKITNSLVPKNEKDYVESNRNFQIIDPSKAGSYFIPTFYPTSRNSNSLIVFLPTYHPSTDYDIITCNTTQSNVKKRYKIPKYQIAGTHIRITKGGAPLEYSRWAYLEDAEYDSLWNRNNGSNRNTIRDIYNMGTLICADHKIFKVTDGYDTHGHNIQGAWYYGDSDYKHGRLSVNGAVARMLWLMPGQTVELVSQIEEINNTKCLVWSVVNASDFTAVNINADLTKRKTYDENFDSLTPIEFHGESGILAPNLSGNVDNWEDCFIAHKKIDNLLLNGETKRIPSLFINRNDPAKDDDYPIAEFYIP